ncbi:MAG TPA: YncE family protein [Pyrinomonadaceae bacterium]|nr:YncE family protein [Pyrinomonadaceae bacterium]
MKSAESTSARKIDSTPCCALTALAIGVLLIACSTRNRLPVDAPLRNSTLPNESSSAGTLPLKILADIPLSGGTTRLDYQSLDSGSGRLYIAHLGSDLMPVFDVNKQTVVGDVKELKRVHGVLAVPELHRVYASATGTNELAVIDDQSLAIVARAPAGDYPDGIAYATKENKIYVSDLHGHADTVIDASTNQRFTTLQLGGGAGNSQYDASSDRIFVTVDGREELAEIDPHTDQVAARYSLTGCKGSHGLLIDSENRLAFAACEGNSKLVVFDLQSKKATATLTVGADPDVLPSTLAFIDFMCRLKAATSPSSTNKNAVCEKSLKVSSRRMLTRSQSIRARIAFTGRCRM